MAAENVINDRRKELGRFLRSRRARVEPQEVGIEEDHRSRGAGLRREEVAHLAHVSVSWYVHLEQGRQIPSPAVLDNLSSALRLDRTEHLYLHALAAPPTLLARTATGSDPESLVTARALVELNQESALPVFALDGQGEVLAANGATSTWYADFTDHHRGRQSGRTNFVWWLYTDPVARVKIVDWRDVVREYTAGFRFHMAANRTDADTTDLLERLDRGSPEFRADWRTYDVANPNVRRRTVVHPQRGPIGLDVVAVQPTVQASIAVVFHLERPARPTRPVTPRARTPRRPGTPRRRAPPGG